MTFLEFETFLLSEECFNNHDVSIIDHDGKQHYVDAENFWVYQAKISSYILSDFTIKVEQYEKNLDINGTAHIFFNKKNGPTFGLHTDPVDVIIKCLDGIKDLEIDGKHVSLKSGEFAYIKSNTKHRALNYEKGLMISYGIGDSETLNRIRENNGDL